MYYFFFKCECSQIFALPQRQADSDSKFYCPSCKSEIIPGEICVLDEIEIKVYGEE
jgi:Zn finger protein HypA/HybF involved in hydrogenase expression